MLKSTRASLSAVSKSVVAIAGGSRTLPETVPHRMSVIELDMKKEEKTSLNPSGGHQADGKLEYMARKRSRKSQDKSRYREFAMSLVHQPVYQAVMGTITILSLVMLVFETDLRAQNISPKGTWLEPCAYVVLAVFVFDIVLRIFAHGVSFFRRFLDQLDFLVVVIDVLLDLVVGLLPDDMPSLSFLKVARIIRLSRIFGSMSEFQELYLILMGIASSVRALVFGSLLILLALVVCSILAVQYVHPVNLQLHEAGVYGDCDECRRAFETVMNASLTFMKTIIAGDSWGQLAVPLMQTSRGASLILVLTYITINLGLLNTIVAVIVDRQAQARENDQAYMRMLHDEELTSSYASLQELFEDLDRDGNGAFDLQEAEAHYDNMADFKQLLNGMDIHKDDLPVVMDMIDTDSSGDISFGEFVAGLHDLRYENAHTLLKFIKYYSEHTFKHTKGFVEATEVLRDMQECVAEHNSLIEQLRNTLAAATECRSSEDSPVDADKGRRAGIQTMASNCGCLRASAHGAYEPMQGDSCPSSTCCESLGAKAVGELGVISKLEGDRPDINHALVAASLNGASHLQGDEEEWVEFATAMQSQFQIATEDVPEKPSTRAEKVTGDANRTLTTSTASFQ